MIFLGGGFSVVVEVEFGFGVGLEEGEDLVCESVSVLRIKELRKTRLLIMPKISIIISPTIFRIIICFDRYRGMVVNNFVVLSLD